MSMVKRVSVRIESDRGNVFELPLSPNEWLVLLGAMNVLADIVQADGIGFDADKEVIHIFCLHMNAVAKLAGDVDYVAELADRLNVFCMDKLTEERG